MKTAEDIVRAVAALGEAAVVRLETAAEEVRATDEGLDRGSKIPHERVVAECNELQAAKEALLVPIRMAVEWVAFEDAPPVCAICSGKREHADQAEGCGWQRIELPNGKPGWLCRDDRRPGYQSGDPLS